METQPVQGPGHRSQDPVQVKAKGQREAEPGHRGGLLVGNTNSLTAVEEERVGRAPPEYRCGALTSRIQPENEHTAGASEPQGSNPQPPGWRLNSAAAERSAPTEPPAAHSGLREELLHAGEGTHCPDDPPGIVSPGSGR